MSTPKLANPAWLISAVDRFRTGGAPVEAGRKIEGLGWAPLDSEVGN